MQTPLHVHSAVILVDQASLGPVVLGQDLSLGKALGFGVVRRLPALLFLALAPPGL